MAITIIKGGKNEFVGHCKWCGCEFRYTAADVNCFRGDVVLCPFQGCGKELRHLGEHGTSSVASGHWFAGYDYSLSAYAQNAQNQAAQNVAQHIAMHGGGDDGKAK